MAIVEIGRGQQISIPTLSLTNGERFKGSVKISDSETLIVELDRGQSGRIPQRIEKMYMLAWEKDGVQRSCQFLVRSHTGSELVGQLIIQERREAPRWRIDVDLRYEPVPAADVSQIADLVMSRVNMADEPGSEANKLLKAEEDPLEEMRAEIVSLKELVQDLAGKVEDLAAAVRGELPVAAMHGMVRPVMVVDCSSLGVGFIAAQPLTAGDYIRIEMKLRATPAINIECMGAVVRCARVQQPGENGPERYDIGVRFTHIHEADRERLIHHLFKVQRHLLRDRKEARAALQP